MMQNYFQAKPPSDTRVEARQPSSGGALLFFIENGSLCLAKEVFHPVKGWQGHDLSKARLRHDMPGAHCSSFASALSVPTPGRTQAIHLAMVASDARGDHLYLSLSNRAADMAADSAQGVAPAWIACPFDAGAPPPRLAITQVQIGDASDRPFVVVDVLIDPDGAQPRRARYSIDIGRGGRPGMDPRWIEHRLSIDSGAGVHASCLGRCRGGWDVDGLYLAGTVGGEAQLLYAPLYNPFNPLQPRWARHLEIPGKLAVGAMAACRNADNTSDLYAVAGDTLYYFSASNQNEGAQALALGSSAAFAGMCSLFATATGGRVMLWGLNGAGQVVCTGAPQVYVADPAAWSEPGVILSDVEAITPSPDGDGVDYAFFARMGGSLVKVTREPGTMLWTGYSIDNFSGNSGDPKRD